jgi:hypothetical protein
MSYLMLRLLTYRKHGDRLGPWGLSPSELKESDRDAGNRSCTASYVRKP